MANTLRQRYSIKKSLAIYDITQNKLSYVDLPSGAKGPVQSYSTPDSKFIYIADQGYYSNQPTNDKLYKIDLIRQSVVDAIGVETAPHGVVVSKDGSRIYATNLVSGSLSIVDTSKNMQILTVKIGKQPNGVSIWDKDNGGTP